MENKEKEYYLYVNGEKLVVTEEVYRAYMQPVWREEKNNYNRARCRDGKGVRCKGECSHCEFMNVRACSNGLDTSFEYLAANECPELESDYNLEDSLITKEMIKRMNEEIDKLSSEETKIIELIKSGISGNKCAELLGISARMFNYKKNKIFEKIRKNLSDFM